MYNSKKERNESFMIVKVLSATAIVLFSVTLIKKAKQVKRNKEQTNYLLRGNKTKRTKMIELFVLLSNYPLLILWFLYIMDWIPIEIVSIGIIFEIIGLNCLYLGVGIYYTALRDLGAHWSIGIKESRFASFVSSGIYQICRHPAYFGFILMYVGIGLLYINLFTALMVALSILSLYLLATEEEVYLQEKFPDEYPKYKERTSKIVPFIKK